MPLSPIKIQVETFFKLNPDEKLFLTLLITTFLIYFQAYMIPPIIPYLAAEFHVSHQMIGLTVPLYMIAYGITSAIFGCLSDRIGRQSVMLLSLFFVTFFSLLTMTAQSVELLLLYRLLCGLTASGTIPQSLTLISERFPTSQKGVRVGWIFSSMIGGMAFGSIGGALLTSIIGWRGAFFVISICLIIVLQKQWEQRHLLETNQPSVRLTLHEFIRSYVYLLKSKKGKLIYGYIFLHGAFHSGIYTWLGLYLIENYHLEQKQIAMALLGYGISGLFTAPIIGRLSDSYGSKTILIIGLMIASFSSLVLIFSPPLIITIFSTIGMAISYVMTQPLLTGMVTELEAHKRGQAMGLNVFLLFLSFGVGAWVFGEILRFGFPLSLLFFTVLMLIATLIAIILFSSEN